MKRITALILALVMLITANCVLAESTEDTDSPATETFVYIVGDAGLRSSMSLGRDEFVHVVEEDGRYIRYTTFLDEEAKRLYDDYNSDRHETTWDELMPYVEALPASITEELDVVPPTQKELDALAGKTLTALAEKGWGIDSVTVPAAEGEEAGTVTQVPVKHKSWYINDEITFWTGPADSEGKVTVSVRKGMFQYNVLVDLPRDAFMEQVRNGKDVWDTKAVSIECAGFSADFASEGFYADGTVRHGGNP